MGSTVLLLQNLQASGRDSCVHEECQCHLMSSWWKLALGITAQRWTQSWDGHGIRESFSWDEGPTCRVRQTKKMLGCSEGKKACTEGKTHRGELFRGATDVHYGCRLHIKGTLLKKSLLLEIPGQLVPRPFLFSCFPRVLALGHMPIQTCGSRGQWLKLNTLAKM